MCILRVKDEDLEFTGIDGGGIPIYHYQEKPFTGILLEYYDEILYREIEYKNGYEEGVENVYYENGKIQYEFNSKNNKLHGICKDWDENGNLLSTSEWKDGVKIK